MTSTGDGGELSFARDIRPLFREKDRDSMMRHFDLFDYADVAAHADAIVGTRRSGRTVSVAIPTPCERTDLTSVNERPGEPNRPCTPELVRRRRDENSPHRVSIAHGKP